MLRFIQTWQSNHLYVGACAAALVVGFLGGLAVIPDGLLQRDRIAFRTIATYFYHHGTVEMRQLGAGWSAPGQDGTWSRGNRSVLLIDLAEDRGKDLELEFVFVPFFAKQHKRQTVRVTVNNQPVGEWVLGAPKRRRIRHVHVKRSIWNAQHPKRISFAYSRPRSPAELGVPGGNERLAIRLSSLVIREQR